VTQDIKELLRVYVAAFRLMQTEIGSLGAQLAEQWFVEQRKQNQSIGVRNYYFQYICHSHWIFNCATGRQFTSHFAYC